VWRFHGIFSYVEGTPFLNCVGPFGTGAAYGSVYADLVEQTGGAKGPICTGDWTNVLSAITSEVVSGTKIGCVYPLPAQTGDPIDPDEVNFEVTSDGGVQEIVPRVMTPSECSTGTAGGWYYDDNLNPTTITLCSETCAWLRALSGAKVQIQIGCASIIKPPA
jgi:hypothetical protein